MSMSPSMHIVVLLALASHAAALAGDAVWQPQHQQQQPLTSQAHKKLDEHAGEPYERGLPFALEAYIEDVMERWHSPGLAISIVNGTETWAKASLPKVQTDPSSQPDRPARGVPSLLTLGVPFFAT